MIFVQLIGCSSRITDEYNNPVLNLQESSYSLGASDVRAVEKKANLYASVSDGFFKPYFKAERLAYPPKNLVMLVLKKEKRNPIVYSPGFWLALHCFNSNQSGKWACRT